MNSQELCTEIRSFCQLHADPAIVKKYARYFKEGFDAYGLPTKDTFKVIEQWFPIGIRNWAHTDGLCSELLDPMLKKNIFSMNDLSKWRKSNYRFQRRAVPVALIKTAKKCNDIHPYLNFINSMMMDPERVVHQGLGWFLREAWKVYPEPVEEFLMKWKNDAARLIFQYATEKMDKEYRLKFRREKNL